MIGGVPLQRIVFCARDEIEVARPWLASLITARARSLPLLRSTLVDFAETLCAFSGWRFSRANKQRPEALSALVKAEAISGGNYQGFHDQGEVNRYRSSLAARLQYLR
jgi:hypothetical protein